MKFNFTEVLFALSYALDCVERELIGVTTNHSKRVAYICVKIGNKWSLTPNERLDLAACALLHDNALTEFILEEYVEHDEKDAKNLKKHCVMGEKNIKKVKFFGNVEGAILYHHENADGTGPLQKKWEEIPLYARIIHLADQLDAEFDLSCVTPHKYQKIIKFLDENKGVLFDEECVAAFHECFNYEAITRLDNEKLDAALHEDIPVIQYTYKNEEVISFAELFATIVDYKSEFTRNHSVGIAQKAVEMGTYYGYDDETKAKLYLAGALHDIGKLAVNGHVLEKPDKLTDSEYKHIQGHAYETFKILKRIEGFEDITSWASHHHEKLNGRGYPFGKTGDELGKNERLMACIDIYQALVEKRPYKDGMTHEQAIGILRKLVKDDHLDGGIVEDINKVFGQRK